jgi:hypothetical protein
MGLFAVSGAGSSTTSSSLLHAAIPDVKSAAKAMAAIAFMQLILFCLVFMMFIFLFFLRYAH